MEEDDDRPPGDGPGGSPPSQDRLLTSGHEDWGISLEYLASLPVDPSATLRQAAAFITGHTAQGTGNRSMVGFLLENEKTRHFVGRANYLVSFARSCTYGETMDALKAHFKGHSDPFLWMELFVVDMYMLKAIKLDLAEWSLAFKGCLNRIGRAILVLIPATRPRMLQSLWCCFEWACIVEANLPYEYCVTPDDEDDMINRMSSGKLGMSDFQDLFAQINVENAKATNETEDQLIRKMMKGIGVVKINEIIMGSVKEWLLHVAATGEARVKEGTREAVCLLNAKADLHHALGQLDKALPLYTKALSEARKVPEFESGVTTMLSNLAGIQMSRGSYDAAEELYSKVISLKTASLGREHPDVATALNNLAGLLEAKGKLEESEALYREALHITKRVLGEQHPATATLLNNLASLVYAKSDLEESLVLCRESLAVRRKVYGDSHPLVAQSLNNVAELLTAKGDFNGAESLFREALLMERIIYGDEHPDVASTLNSLSAMLAAKGDLRTARKMFQEALSIQKKTLGELHPDVANTVWWIAKLAEMEGDYATAIRLTQQALMIYENTLGRTHPRTEEVRAFKVYLDKR